MTEWVRQRDGTQDAFDADRICRALFLAGERLGRSDAFLARELTDGVLHFLSADLDDSVVTVEDLRELVIKTVRELGHPHLAHAYQEVTARGTLATPTPRSAAFPPELLSAHTEGLLLLGDLDQSNLLAARVFPWPRSAEELGPSLDRFTAGTTALVFDGPEHWLAFVGQSPAWFRDQLTNALRLRPREVVLNLNRPTPPHDVPTADVGPLFGQPQARGKGPDDLAFQFAEQVGPPTERLFWHLPAGSVQQERLTALAQRIVCGTRVEFVLDRPRRNLHLAEGVDREEPALLLRVAVRLPRLLGALGHEPDVDSLLQKVGTLARLALSAGVHKRATLRRLARPEHSEGFLLDRARLQVIPLGLDVVVERITGRPLVHGGAALDLGRRVLRRLREVLTQDGRGLQLATCIDDPSPGMVPEDDLPGLDIPDHRAEAIRRIRSASQIQEVTERGLLTLTLPNDPAEAVPRLLGLLDQIATVSAIDRVRFLPLEVSQ